MPSHRIHRLVGRLVCSYYDQFIDRLIDSSDAALHDVSDLATQLATLTGSLLSEVVRSDASRRSAHLLAKQLERIVECSASEARRSLHDASRYSIDHLVKQVEIVIPRAKELYATSCFITT